jgi:4-amino-4-deoxy-L-arabinose transferase-like glycosyltransferase
METDNANAAWRGAGLLAAALVAALYLYPLAIAGSIPLLDPDEGIHATIAQEIVDHGDWITPHLLDKPFLDKPILYFWAQALSLHLLGMSEAAVRLPGLMFGLLGALTTGWLGARMLDRQTGLIAGLFYGTMIFPVALCQAAAPDVALVPWVNLAVLSFWEMLRGGSRRRAMLATLAAGLALGLAILTKGLVGVALVGIACGMYVLLGRRLNVSVCGYGALALLVALLVAAPWYVAVEVRNPGYLHYYFVGRHLLGFATETQRHGGQPWWYYLPILLGGGLPWIAYLPVMISEAWANWRTGRADMAAPNVLLWSWLIGGVVLLTVSHSKLATYIWPLFPAVALLAAVVWAAWLKGRLSDRSRAMLSSTFWISTAAGPLVLPLAMVGAGRVFSLRFAPATWAVGMLIAALAWTPLWLWRRQRARAALAAAMLGMAAQFAFIMTAVLPPAAAVLSARDLAVYFNDLGELPPRLYVTEERVGSLAFYLRPELRMNLREDQLRRLKFDRLTGPPEVIPGTVLAVAERKVGRAEEYFDFRDSEYQRAGRYRLYRMADLEFYPRHGTGRGVWDLAAGRSFRVARGEPVR